MSDEDYKMTITALIGIASVATVAAFFTFVIYVARKEGASNVLEADSVATAKGTAKAAQEIAKSVETSDTIDKLDKGEF